MVQQQPPHPGVIQQPPHSGGINGGGGGEFWAQPQPPLNNYCDSRSLFENSNSNPHPHPPPYKRPRHSENNTNPSNLAPLPPTVHKGNPSTIPVNRGTTHIFFKTRMCQKFLEGNCRNGDKCTFAHGSNDLREPPPNWQELVKGNRGGGGGENSNDDQNIIHKMKICRRYYNGEQCPYGEKCNFLHVRRAEFKPDLSTDMEETRDSSVINIRTMGTNMDCIIGAGQADFSRRLDNSSDAIQVSNAGANPDVLRASVKPTYWKTRICSKWEATGQCPFGDRCHYAHGLAELQVPVGRVEADGHPSAAGSIPLNAFNVPVSEVLPADAAALVPVQQGEARCSARGKLAHKKLNRIYADWIDDLEDEQVTANKVD